MAGGFLFRAGDRGPLAQEERALIELRYKEEGKIKEDLNRFFIDSESEGGGGYDYIR